MTDSELFALMTCGFSTVAGSAFAAYIGLKCQSNKSVVKLTIIIFNKDLVYRQIIYLFQV